MIAESAQRFFCVPTYKYGMLYYIQATRQTVTDFNVLSHQLFCPSMKNYIFYTINIAYTHKIWALKCTVPEANVLTWPTDIRKIEARRRVQKWQNLPRQENRLEIKWVFSLILFYFLILMIPYRIDHLVIEIIRKRVTFDEKNSISENVHLLKVKTLLPLK